MANPTICLGGGTALTGPATAVTHTWYAPGPSGPQVIGSNINPIVVTPTSNTTYTVISTTAQNCPITATANVYVQGISMSVSPSSQTMCAGSTVCFTAQVQALNNASYTPGTATTSIEWYVPGQPPGTPFSTALTTCTNAQAGNFHAIVTHTGAAGVCTYSLPAAVVTATSIPALVSASANSVCPNNPVTLTATSVATSYTWTAVPGGNTFTGASVVVSPSVNTCYHLEGDFAGCPAFGTVCVGMNTLTPGLSASQQSMCAGTEFTLFATGGDEYTFYHVTPGGNVAISSPSTINTDQAHSPSSVPATYSVAAFQGGCSGAATFTVYPFIITPSIVPSSFSVCPNSAFTMTATNVGSHPADPTTYTFIAPYLVSGTSSVISISPFTASAVAHNVGNNLNPCRTYTVNVDSMGCPGTAQVQICRRVLYPTLVPSTPSICPGTQFTLTATGVQGTATEYTFRANYVVTAPNSSIVPNPPSVFTRTAVATPPSLPRTFSVTVDSAGCRGTASVTVGRLNLGISVNFSVVAPTNSVCPGQTFTLATSTGTGTTVKVTSPVAPAGSLTPVPGTVNQWTNSVLNNAFPKTFTLQADSLGCTGTRTLNVDRFNINPVLSASPNPVCANIPVTLSVSGVATGTFTFLRPGAPFFTVQTGPSNTANHSPLVPTTYTAVVDSANCIGTSSIAVTISPPLVVSATASTPTICAGQQMTLNVAGPSTANYTWVASNSTGTYIVGFPGMPWSTASVGIVQNPSVTTTYSVFAKDAPGCEGNSAVTVSINPAAQLSLWDPLESTCRHASLSIL